MFFFFFFSDTLSSCGTCDLCGLHSGHADKCAMRVLQNLSVLDDKTANTDTTSTRSSTFGDDDYHSTSITTDTDSSTIGNDDGFLSGTDAVPVTPLSLMKTDTEAVADMYIDNTAVDSSQSLPCSFLSGTLIV